MSRVIGASEIEALAASGQSQVDVPAGAIVTPAARDRARELGIQLGAAALAPPASGAHSASSNGYSGGAYLPAGGGGRWVRPGSSTPRITQNAGPAPTMPAARPPSTPGVPGARYPEIRPGLHERPPGVHEMDIKPNYFESPAIDNLFTISMELGAAIWVVKDRLRVIEELLERAGVVTQTMVEQYAPDPEKRQEIIRQRNAFIEKIYGIIKENPG